VQVAPSVRSANEYRAVRVRLPNPTGELKAGIFATGADRGRDSSERAGCAAGSAGIEGDEAFVFVPQGEKVEKRKVTVGIRDEGHAEILEDSRITSSSYGRRLRLATVRRSRFVQGEEKKDGADKKSEKKSDIEDEK